MLGGTVQRIARVVGQFLTAIGGRSRTVQNRNSVAENHDFLPTCPPRKVVIEVGKFVSAGGDIKFSSEYKLDFHGTQTAGAVGKCHLVRYRI